MEHHSMNIESFLSLVSARHSCRSYKKDVPVPNEAIEKCLEAARLSPSACNKQPWRFIIVTERQTLDRICTEALLPGIPMPWLKNAPAIAILCAETSIKVHWLAPILSGIQYHLVDLGIAGEHFILAAQAQDIGTCWIGWFKEKPLKKMLGIPSSVQVVSLISMGYEDEKQGQPNKFNTVKIAHSEKWNNPF